MIKYRTHPNRVLLRSLCRNYGLIKIGVDFFDVIINYNNDLPENLSLVSLL